MDGRRKKVDGWLWILSDTQIRSRIPIKKELSLKVASQQEKVTENASVTYAMKESHNELNIRIE